MSFYPAAVGDAILAAAERKAVDRPNAVGRAASFECGSSVRALLSIDPAVKQISACSFYSNGCGFMIASAEVLLRILEGSSLTDLHGLPNNRLEEVIAAELGELPVQRRQCARIAIEAVRDALAAYRTAVASEFRGGEVLICTCFGVDERTIESLIETHQIADIGQLMKHSNAGTGCGSCRLLIQELIDRSDHP